MTPKNINIEIDAWKILNQIKGIITDYRGETATHSQAIQFLEGRAKAFEIITTPLSIAQIDDILLELWEKYGFGTLPSCETCDKEDKLSLAENTDQGWYFYCNEACKNAYSKQLLEK